MSETALITPRRNFLIRALGFTAAGATLAVPVIALDTPEARFNHHLRGAEAAMRELLPAWHVRLQGNCLAGCHRDYQDLMSDPERGRGSYACAILTAGPA